MQNEICTFAGEFETKTNVKLGLMSDGCIEKKIIYASRVNNSTARWWEKNVSYYNGTYWILINLCDPSTATYVVRDHLALWRWPTSVWTQAKSLIRKRAHSNYWNRLDSTASMLFIYVERAEIADAATAAVSRWNVTIWHRQTSNSTTFPRRSSKRVFTFDWRLPTHMYCL